MLTIPAPTRVSEEWPDADFDFPDGADITPPSASDWDKDDDEEDWDMEMGFGKTGGAKAKVSVPPGTASIRSSPLAKGSMVCIRPPLNMANEAASPVDGDDDEGISTIKFSELPTTLAKMTGDVGAPSADDDMEADFALPSELTQLSLRPLSLHHRGSKASFEWGDHTTSSASSSDAYSTLGFHPSNNSTVISLPDTDADFNDNDETDLDGLVIPTGLFESDQGRKHLTKILDQKKKIPKIEERSNVASPNPEDDFEIGLVINGDDDLSPSKFAQTQETKRGGIVTTRSNSMPARTPTLSRPPSRLKGDRPKTPGPHLMNRAPSRSSFAPPLRPTLSRRTQTLQALPSPPPPVPSSFVPPKQGQNKIRNQKSHGVLKTPPTNTRKLSRKASLSALLETSSAQENSVPESSSSQPQPSYSAATAASRARMHANSISRLQVGGMHVPPTRPSTPSENPTALRLTMPTCLSRLKTRPSISGIFPPPTPPLPPTPTSIPPQQRPASRSSTLAPVSAPVKSSRRLKRREFGDGTELDAIEDLPTDRDKEAKFRVQPKATQNRIPSTSSTKTERESTKGIIRRKKEQSENTAQPATTSLKHKHSRLDGLSKNEKSQKRKPSSAQTRRKPTLIRNLGGVGAPKVVGEMRWNPQTLRWEGNDQALRDFDPASARPALITHLTGSSVNGSPGGISAPAARVVGNMVFDPIRMCWMSTLPPEEEEPDIFADLADDEDGDWEKKGGTIRASIVRPSTSTDTGSQSDSSKRTCSPAPSVRSRAQSIARSDSDHGSRASIVFELEDNFIELCRAAEARHKVEMKGWILHRNESSSSFSEPDRSYLYEIRTVATRQY
ncbi:hypothetical protein ACEPAI_822 [Sanghuangporus weigelae]